VASQTGHNGQAKTHRNITVLRLKMPTRGGYLSFLPFLPSQGGRIEQAVTQVTIKYSQKEMAGNYSRHLWFLQMKHFDEMFNLLMTVSLL